MRASTPGASRRSGGERHRGRAGCRGRPAPASRCATCTTTPRRAASSCAPRAPSSAHCDEVFTRIALSRPDVAFSLQHNGRTLWRAARRSSAGSAHARCSARSSTAARLHLDEAQRRRAAVGLGRLAHLQSQRARLPVLFRERPLRARPPASRTPSARLSTTCCIRSAIRPSCCSWRSIPRGSTSTCIRPRARYAFAIRRPCTSSCSTR